MEKVLKKAHISYILACHLQNWWGSGPSLPLWWRSGSGSLTLLKVQLELICWKKTTQCDFCSLVGSNLLEETTNKLHKVRHAKKNNKNIRIPTIDFIIMVLWRDVSYFNVQNPGIGSYLSIISLNYLSGYFRRIFSPSARLFSNGCSSLKTTEILIQKNNINRYA
jgi:hypothetical protein